MPQLLRDATPTARKPHRCSACGTTIEPGATYSRATYIYDGRVYDWVSCQGCEEITGVVWHWAGSPDEGITAEDYAEWANDHLHHKELGPNAQALVGRLLDGEPLRTDRP